MTLAPPSVYIGTELMDSHALDDMPVLAGLNFSWGNDDQVDFDAPATLAAQLLIKTPGNLDFLAVGVPFGLMDAATGKTFFAGRIATLKAKADKRRKGALLVSLTARDTLADLAGYRVEDAQWYNPADPNHYYYAPDRRAQLAASIAPGWQLIAGPGATSYDWTSARAQHWVAEPWLPLLDMHCRATNNRRHVTSRYIPGTGLAPAITIARERSKAAATDTLGTRSDATWYASTPAPTNTAYIQIEAGHVAHELEWEKTPDDVITDVQLSVAGFIPVYTAEAGWTFPPSEHNTYDVWTPNYPNVDNTAIQAAYGHHRIELEIDSNPDTASNHVSFLLDYWIDADTEWRPTGIEIPDSRRLTDATVLDLLDVGTRYLAYLTISKLPAASPIGLSKVRAYIIAGQAEWTGKKWVIGLTLGRVPRAPAAGGTMTFDSIETHPNPNISAATAETVGDALTFADFAYIGG